MTTLLAPPRPSPASSRFTVRAPERRAAPADTTDLLMEALPQSLLRALGELPRRLLFTNANLSLLLVGLADGQTVRRLRPPSLVLLTVAFGRVTLVEDDWRFTLAEGQQWTLEPRATYDFEADGCVDLLLLLHADAAPR